MQDDKVMKEKMAFDELKKRMKGDMEKEMYEDDNLFYRFLRARDFKVDNSETMLRQHLEWRKKVDLKNIRKWNPPEVVKKHFILTKLGYDKDGCIVKYNHFGNTDLRGIFQSCTAEDWMKSLIHYFEEDVQDLQKQTSKLGKIVDKVVYIENAENFSLATATDKKVITNMTSSIIMYLNNYPETLKTTYIINAPTYFLIFFSILKAFLPSTVINKIRIFSDDSWKRAILETIDAEIIPAFLGGKKTDPDGNPLCVTLIQNSEPVPKTFYMKKSKRSFPTLVGAEKVHVSRGSIHEVPFEVKEPGCYLEWEFELKSGDIKFGLCFKDKEGHNIDLIPFQRINTDESAESGVYKCENTGHYIVTFDNSYSYIKAKEIYYNIKLKNSQ